MDNTNAIKAITLAEAPAAVGCMIDGHWGQYGVARMVDIAVAHGYTDESKAGGDLVDIAARHLAAGTDISDYEHEVLVDGADEVETWLNDHVAPEGYRFGWHDGEFYFEATSRWEEA